VKKPKRIQRRRAKGWRLPEGAVCVDRSTRYGNPFVVGRDGSAEECIAYYRALASGFICVSCPRVSLQAQEDARAAMLDAKRELKGKDLACWCRLDRPCHADVLLEIANC
jgi:hypothetical protein